MPLAYAHIVQVLLDVVLWMYPFMALSTGMAWHISIVGTGLLTMFYQGLFDLAKQFLDPYDNENYGKGDDPLVIDTLIAETNAGSVRWMNSFQQQPWNKQLLKDGEMYDSLLPLRGYSVEEIMEKEAQEEAERKERERQIKEKKLKDEEKERRRAETMLMDNFYLIQNETGSMVGQKLNGTAVLSPGGDALMSNGLDGNGARGTQILMEVQGGQVVATSSLLPSSMLKSDEELGLMDGAVESKDDDSDTEVVKKREPTTLLTLEDGTLVDIADASISINATELEERATDDFTSTGTKEDTTDDSIDAEALPPLLDGSNEVSWDKLLATTPNFEESIVEMEQYKTSPTVVYSEGDDVYGESDQDVNDEDMEGDDVFEPFSIEWFDEVGPDGKEYRLSQMLADEDWIEEHLEYDADDSKNKTMTYEEFTQKASSLIEQAENELMETAEIMSSSPGSQAEYDAKKSRDTSSSPVVSIPKRAIVLDEPDPLYDQTRLDAISQLWGAPPEVLERKMVEDDDDEKQQRLTNEDIDFANVYSLWGMHVPSKASSSEEEETTMSSPSMEGYRQLWRDNALSPTDEEGKADGDSRQTDFSIEWWDEVSDDGKEYRLSMMLADEEYEEELEVEDDSIPMTFEQFAIETESLILQAEEERKEEEMIMNAPPNANFLDDDETSGDSSSSTMEETFAAVAASDKFEEMVMSLTQGQGMEDVDEILMSESDMDVLDMDEEEIDEKLNNEDDSLPSEDALTLSMKLFGSLNSSDETTS